MLEPKINNQLGLFQTSLSMPEMSHTGDDSIFANCEDKMGNYIEDFSRREIISYSLMSSETVFAYFTSSFSIQHYFTLCSLHT